MLKEVWFLVMVWVCYASTTLEPNAGNYYMMTTRQFNAQQMLDWGWLVSRREGKAFGTCMGNRANVETYAI